MTIPWSMEQDNICKVKLHVKDIQYKLIHIHPNHPSIHPPINPSLHSPTNPSTLPSTHRSIHPSINSFSSTHPSFHSILSFNRPKYKNLFLEIVFICVLKTTKFQFRKCSKNNFNPVISIQSFQSDWFSVITNNWEKNTRSTRLPGTLNYRENLESS